MGVRRWHQYILNQNIALIKDSCGRHEIKMASTNIIRGENDMVCDTIYVLNPINSKKEA